MKTHIIERAFQLAATGEYSKVESIRCQLKAEKYDSVDLHISGPTIMRQLRVLLGTSVAGRGQDTIAAI